VTVTLWAGTSAPPVTPLKFTVCKVASSLIVTGAIGLIVGAKFGVGASTVIVKFAEKLSFKPPFSVPPLSVPVMTMVDVPC
jgi:hypothetical protein